MNINIYIHGIHEIINKTKRIGVLAGKVWFLLQGLDVLTTYIGVLCLGMYEISPVPRALMEKYGVYGLIMSKAGWVILGLIAYLILRYYTPKPDKYLIFLLGAYILVVTCFIISDIYFTYVVANNIYWLGWWLLKNTA